METDQYNDPAAVFPQIVTNAVSKLKNRLQQDYERAYPDLGDLVRIVLDEEEAKAWDLSFPHLFLGRPKRSARSGLCGLLNNTGRLRDASRLGLNSLSRTRED